MRRDLTTKEIAEKFKVEDQVARRWCREGRFPNAYQLPIQTGTGRIWLVPKSDLKDFRKPGKGRPRSENPSAEAVKKRETRAKKKE